MNELRKLRESLNITQIEAADILNISRRTYQKYESLNEDNDDKLQYFIFKLKSIVQIEGKDILNIDDIKLKITDILSKYNINFCYLFGSYARNSATSTSDIDLLIDSDITGLDFFGLVEELRTTLGKNIDLLKLNQLNNNPELLKNILKDGIKIYEQ